MLIRHEINRRYAPTHLSYKKLQKETLCDIQLSSLTFLVEKSVAYKKKRVYQPNVLLQTHNVLGVTFYKTREAKYSTQPSGEGSNPKKH